MQVIGGLFELASVKVGVFVRLNASARNCRRNRSVKRTCLKREKSKLTEPGPRATRRAESPNIWICAPVLLGIVPGTRNAAG